MANAFKIPPKMPCTQTDGHLWRLPDAIRLDRIKDLFSDLFFQDMEKISLLLTFKHVCNWFVKKILLNFFSF